MFPQVDYLWKVGVIMIFALWTNNTPETLVTQTVPKGTLAFQTLAPGTMAN